ncbi:MAG TPA: hypothetical protein VFQ12_09825, partial [Thermoleophilaceae bacterium]|nr:hypothetical protein [Thermoleophilaceae bacterium]
MKRLTRLRPSPATLISLIALFVSLGGVSYGVATGYIDSREIKNNTVRSRDLRNNDIRTKDLRNNEIRGLDIRNSTIRGRDVAVSTLTGTNIRENTLAEVPLATRATSADAVSSLRVIPATVVSQGAAPRALTTYGPLTVSAACTPTGSGPRAEVRVQSSEAGSAADGEEGSFPSLGASPQAEAAVTSIGQRVVESSPI